METLKAEAFWILCVVKKNSCYIKLLVYHLLSSANFKVTMQSKLSMLILYRILQHYEWFIVQIIIFNQNHKRPFKKCLGPRTGRHWLSNDQASNNPIKSRRTKSNPLFNFPIPETLHVTIWKKTPVSCLAHTAECVCPCVYIYFYIY